MTTKCNRILIIDDDTNLRKTLDDILRAKGYEILAAGEGREGLALLHEQPCNLVLVDLELPDMSGLEIVKSIQADYPFTQAIVLTGNATLDSAIQATGCGAFSYILKPYDIDQLLMQIRLAIDKQTVDKELHLTRQMLENVTQGITESILLLSRDCKILWANRTALAQTELTMDEIVENYCYTVTHHRDSPCDCLEEQCPVHELLETGKSMTVNHAHVNKEGKTVIAEIAIYPVKNSAGDLTELVHVSRDITERVRMEQELADKVVQLEASLARVKLLEGIIPICMYCKNIRDDKESWQQMEEYISHHSEAYFSHGICPDCYSKQLIELENMKNT